MADEVVLLDFWPSPFAMRAKLALELKGINYECKQQDLLNKDPLLLQMNPVHKKIPVLIHNGKPVCESLVIVRYIDEVWNHVSPLLPSDPYRRSQALFWTDYIEKTVYGVGRRIFIATGEEQEKAKEELIQFLKTIETELGEKLYFGGDSIGFVDVALLPFTAWFYTYETCGNFSIEESCPKLIEWVKRCTQKESVSKAIAHPHKIYDFFLEYKEKLGGN
uniref:Glutathione S-transferase n=1 Tax=Malva pusilla TaxID=96480 RepID=Q84VH1_MALPU|nr:glutathione S-transferase U2 [Malva pusilla]